MTAKAAEDSDRDNKSSGFYGRISVADVWKWSAVFVAGFLFAQAQDASHPFANLYGFLYGGEADSDYENSYETLPVDCRSMGLDFDEFLEAVLFRKTIYDDFDGQNTRDIGFYFANDVFETVFSDYFHAQPNLTSMRIIEVGSWAGRSTMNIARLCERFATGRPCSVVAVDTWTGSSEHYEGFGLPRNTNGNIMLYEHFMNNVKQAGLSHVITPFRVTSSAAAHVFGCFNVSVDMVYLDGDHEYPAISRDIRSYYEILKPNGVLVGDDFVLNGVRKAVEEFSAATRERYAVLGDKWKTWVMKKTAQ